MTGYTQELVDRKLGFEDFALLCCRAFGVLVTMRDEPLAAPVPELLPANDYHFKAFHRAKKELAKLKAIKLKKDRTAWGRNRLKKDLSIYQKRRDEIKDADAPGQMRVVLRQAEAWTPPHTQYEDFKKFMIQQLTDSIAMEERSGDFYGEQITKLQATSPLDAYKTAVAKAKTDVDYHKKEWREELARTKTRNQWLKQLRRSLKK